jgi:hypothetical protein
MKLIKLTRYNGGKETCYVKASVVTGVARHDPDNCTIVYDGCNTAYYVSETVGQVLGMLKEATEDNTLTIISKDAKTIHLGEIE